MWRIRRRNDFQRSRCKEARIYKKAERENRTRIPNYFLACAYRYIVYAPSDSQLGMLVHDSLASHGGNNATRRVTRGA